MMRVGLIGLTAMAALTLGACHGPKEKAGEAQDKANAAASGVAYTGNGPNEQAGEAQDRVDRASAKARDAQADALKQAGPGGPLPRRCPSR